MPTAAMKKHRQSEAADAPPELEPMPATADPTPPSDVADLRRQVAALESRLKAVEPAPIVEEPPSPPPPDLRQPVDTRWNWVGWKSFVTDLVADLKHRSFIYASVNKASAEASRRRAMGMAGRSHPITRINSVLAGLSDRLRRADREAIYPPELANIRRALDDHGEIAGMYEVAASAASAMLADARESFDGIGTAFTRFDEPSPYLTEAARACGLPPDLARRALEIVEVRRISDRFRPLVERLRRVTRGEDGSPILSLKEREEIDAAIRCAGDESIKLIVMSGAMSEMISEGYAALGIDRPDRGGDRVLELIGEGA